MPCLHRCTGNRSHRAQAPPMEHCNTQDQNFKGARQMRSLLVSMPPSSSMGSRSAAWSGAGHKCQSCGDGIRSSDRVPGQHVIAVAGSIFSAAPTFVSSHDRILDSGMVFDATLTQQVPAITGTLQIDGIIKAPSATLPAITPPGK